MPEDCSRLYSITYTMESAIGRRIPAAAQLSSSESDSWLHHSFINGAEAESVLESCSHAPAKCALLLLHEGILDCMGLSPEPWSIPQRRVPSQPLDLAWFYRSVISIIQSWDTEYCDLFIYDRSIDEYMKDPDLPRLTRLKEENLRIFILKLNSLTDIPAATDKSYCAWLFAETILVENLLPQILNGRVERWFYEPKVNSNEWLNGWFRTVPAE